MNVWVFIFLLGVGNCQSLPKFEHQKRSLPNNSYIYYPDISDGDQTLRCVTDNVNCCNSSDVINWRDESRTLVYEGADGTSCLYVTRGDGVISLQRKRGCSDHTSGLWRCDIPDSSGEMQSLYMYIGDKITYNKRGYNPLGQLVDSVTMNFTLHTEPNASVPEYTISCRTRGGPARTVQWTVNGSRVQEDSYHEISQLILDTSLDSVYDNRLRVRGRRSGTYNCTVSNNIRYFLPSLIAHPVNGSLVVLVAGEPTNFTAVISEPNSTHVDITLSWESPGDPVTDGYVIYYQPKGGPVTSDRVFGGETDTHSLDGLQRGVTYYISLVALSPHLPNPLVGPITVITDPLLVVETSPESLNTLHNIQFSVNCTARAEIDGEPLTVTIEWRRVTPSGTSELMPALYTTTGSPERDYQSVLTTSENDSTVNITIYRCTATTHNYSSFSDTTVYFEGIIPSPSRGPSTLRDQITSSFTVPIKTTTKGIYSAATGLSTSGKSTSKYSSAVTMATTSTHDRASSVKPTVYPSPTSAPHECIIATVTACPANDKCTCAKERESCVGEMAVIGGGVFGVMSLVIVSLVTVLLTLICKRSAGSRDSKKVETHSNTAYGVVVPARRDEPEYEVIQLSRRAATTASGL